MKRVSASHDASIPTAARVLKSGGVAVLPTDTLYGFSAAMSSRAAYESILSLKGYQDARGFVYLADSAALVERYIAGWGCTSRGELESHWPAPLTAVLTAGTGCVEWAGESVAFRVPALSWLRNLIAEVGEPLLSTSVNRAGEQPLHEPGDIERAFGRGIDIIVTGEEHPGMPSTIVDFTGQTPVVLREGAASW